MDIRCDFVSERDEAEDAVLHFSDSIFFLRKRYKENLLQVLLKAGQLICCTILVKKPVNMRFTKNFPLDCSLS